MKLDNHFIAQQSSNVVVTFGLFLVAFLVVFCCKKLLSGEVCFWEEIFALFYSYDNCGLWRRVTCDRGFIMSSLAYFRDGSPRNECISIGCFIILQNTFKPSYYVTYQFGLAKAMEDKRQTS